MSMRPATTHAVQTDNGDVKVHVWEHPNGDPPIGTVVTVHPWSALGGGEHNTVGVARELASRGGLRCLTFQLRGGSSLWGLCTAHKSEVGQVVAVTEWAMSQYGKPIVLLGSSAGAPIGGSALPRLPDVFAFVAVGYTFGRFATLGFGRHFGSVLNWEKPKLFIMGENDEFTSPSQLEARVGKAKGKENKAHIVPGVGHFELESPSYDGEVSSIALEWLRSLPLPSPQPAGRNPKEPANLSG